MDCPRLQPRPYRWNVIPSRIGDPCLGGKLINARAETVAPKPAFGKTFRERRCLILADGFYEWQRQDHRKQPFYILLRDGRPFAFAGIWERWVPPDSQPLDSCTIITTTSNDLVGRIPQRMPVILAPEDYEAWLDAGVQEIERLQPLLHPYPSGQMTAYAVARE